MAHVIRSLHSRVSLRNSSGLTFGTDHAGYPYATGILAEKLEALLQDLVEERLQPRQKGTIWAPFWYENNNRWKRKMATLAPADRLNGDLLSRLKPLPQNL